MIKFINLKSGKLFDADIVYNEEMDIIDYDKSYIHWIPDVQSTDIIYTPYICFVSNEQSLNISIEQNDIFKLLDASKFNSAEDKNINGILYKNINDLVIEGNNYDSTGEQYNDKYYIHTIYFKVQSEIEGEAIVEFKIDGKSYLIGADFYLDNELYKINLQNYNINIPDQVQKALYPSNVREDKRDNILLNRKWKELLSNYWDIVANKGSYKSLINSLNWFEYGDLIKLKEYWKTEDFFKTIYSGKSIESVLSDKYSDILTTSSKTTYIGIYTALQELDKVDGQVTYDEEKNPILKNVAFDISLNDLYIKMSLLGVFYETFFMPIHLDLIHSTVENIVFANTIKVCKAALLSREDVVCPTNRIDCSLGDGTIFAIGKNDAYVHVDADTNFGKQYEEGDVYDKIFRIGVLDANSEIAKANNNQDLKTFWTQYYNGPGVIVSFDVNLYNSDVNDFVNFEQIVMVPDGCNEEKILTNNKIFKFTQIENENVANIKFKILCTEEREYNIKLLFKTAASVYYTKNIKFNVVCIDNASIDIYKVCNGNKPGDIPATKYLFSRTNLNKLELLDQSTSKYSNNTGINPDDYDCSNCYYTQYIPAVAASDNDNGVKLNNILIFKSGDGKIEVFPEDLKNKYDLYYKYELNNNGEIIQDHILYTIGISKDFVDSPIGKEYLEDLTPYRNDLIYMPEKHHLEKLTINNDNPSIDDYTIDNTDTLCLVPNFSFSHLINSDGQEWEFENASTGDIIQLPSIQTPYVADTENRYIPNGYYNIIFKYRLIGNKKEQILKIDSAFKKVDKKL